MKWNFLNLVMGTALGLTMANAAVAMEDLPEEAGSTRRQSVGQKELESEKQAKASFWGSGIDRDIQYINDLKDYNVQSYGVILGTLEAMKEYYTNEARTGFEPMYVRYNLNIEALKYCEWLYSDCWNDGLGDVLITEARRAPLIMHPNNGLHPKFRGFMYDLAKEVKGIVEKKMENYEEIQGSKHPRRDELSTIFP